MIFSYSAYFPLKKPFKCNINNKKIKPPYKIRNRIKPYISYSLSKRVSPLHTAMPNRPGWCSSGLAAGWADWYTFRAAVGSSPSGRSSVSGPGWSRSRRWIGLVASCSSVLSASGCSFRLSVVSKGRSPSGQIHHGLPSFVLVFEVPARVFLSAVGRSGSAVLSVPPDIYESPYLAN